MPLELKIISEHADLVGDDSTREFHDDGGTIGRSLQNDWILPDPDRFISGRHAAIDFKGGIYYLIDTSSNGVYINNDMEPIGKGNPRRLFDGDTLRMGDFQFRVAVDCGESLIMPPEEKQSLMRDNTEQFVDEVSLRTGMKLIDEEELTGDDEFQSALFGSSQPAVDPEPISAAEPKIEVEVKVEVEVEAEAEVKVEVEVDNKEETPSTDAIEVTAEDLFDSFLDGLGISRVELHPSVDRPEMMLTAGQVLREFVSGATDLLSNRANLKNTFRLDQTTVLPSQNNPMKFSENTTDLLKQLLIGGEGEYLGAKDSVREVCKNLIHHQNAFLDAMNSAFINFADRFEPDELQEGFDRKLGGGLLSFMNTSKYWSLYRDLYPIITEKGGGRFPQMFGDEFVKAYERQIAEYQRIDHAGVKQTFAENSGDQAIDPGLLETQKLDQPMAAVETALEVEDDLDPLSDTDASIIDSSFIEELEKSMAEENSQAQLKA
jgi:type VI secretion system FHA domain protein